MNFEPGSGSTIQAITLEGQCYSIARTIQTFERSSVHNPGNEINMITSSSNDDTQVFSGKCLIYAEHKGMPGFQGSIEYKNPYVNTPEWSEGSEGNGTANTWVEALVERYLALATLERNPTYNTSNQDLKITDITWSFLDEFLLLPVEHNCTLGFDFRLDYEVLNSNNAILTQAVPYLAGEYPGWN